MEAAFAERDEEPGPFGSIATSPATLPLRPLRPFASSPPSFALPGPRRPGRRAGRAAALPPQESKPPGGVRS
eukprot:8990851-Pyramimonas_sp.AAC.1